MFEFLLTFGIGVLVSTVLYQKYYYWKRRRRYRAVCKRAEDLQPICEAAYSFAIDCQLRPE